MKLAFILGIVGAALLHLGIILFGGLLFFDEETDHGTQQEVELLSEDVAKDASEEKPQETDEQLEAEDEEAPDAAELLRNLELTPAAAPELDAVSLGAIEAALSGIAGSGDFVSAVDFASGGRIGGTGQAGAGDASLEYAFSLDEIDQKPRAVYQSSPIYPSEMRGKKVEGVVTLIFIVEPDGKVSNPRVEQSNHAAFNKPALDAIKRWKFEPGVRGGERVARPMRVAIRFQPSET